MASSGRAAKHRYPSARCTEGTVVPRVGPCAPEAQVFGGSGVPASRVQRALGLLHQNPASDVAPGGLRGEWRGLFSEDMGLGDLDGQGHLWQGNVQASCQDWIRVVTATCGVDRALRESRGWVCLAHCCNPRRRPQQTRVRGEEWTKR